MRKSSSRRYQHLDSCITQGIQGSAPSNALGRHGKAQRQLSHIHHNNILILGHIMLIWLVSLKDRTSRRSASPTHGASPTQR